MVVFSESERATLSVSDASDTATALLLSDLQSGDLH